MADPRFFPAAGPFTLSQLAGISGAEARPASMAAGTAPYRDVAALDAAGPAEVSFIDNRRYIAAFAASRAGVCVAPPDLAERAPAGMSLLVSKAPYRAYALVAGAFHPPARGQTGIHAAAIVDPTAKLGPEVTVEAGAVISARAEIGARTRVCANATLAEGVALGEDCVVGAGASLSHCIVGARVNIYPGARIGQDGFGFATVGGKHLKVPQLGRVLISDDCEIGANSCIDRGSASDTVIGPGCQVDNLVQIGHNVKLGKGVVVVAQAGVSGSTRLDDYVVAGGQVGFAGHLHIGAGAQVAAQSGVHKDVAPGAVVGGYPAVPIQEWRRGAARLRQLARRKGE